MIIAFIQIDDNVMSAPINASLKKYDLQNQMIDL